MLYALYYRRISLLASARFLCIIIQYLNKIMSKNLSKIFFVGLTGEKLNDLLLKINEAENFGLKDVSLFLEFFKKAERDKIYESLLASKIKNIPLVHIRHDFEKDELNFLKNKFKTKYFTIHESSFARDDIKKWKGFYKKLYLEMNFDNFVSNKVNVEKIGGFCVDLSHFKVGMEKLSRDFEYVFNKKGDIKYFDCNHLNGYNLKTNCDMHTINNLSDFDYLKTLPKFLFGKCIALETFNSVREQMEFKKYLSKILK